MNMLKFIKHNFIKLLIQILFIVVLLISIFSIEFSIRILHDDGKSVNYVGIIRGGTQLLVKQELANRPSNELIEELDGIISQLKTHDENNHFAIHEDKKLQELLSVIEVKWVELKEEIYNYRAGTDPLRLYNLSNEYYELSNSMVFETQAYVESKVEKLDSMRTRLFISVILILIFSIQQFISKILVQNKNVALNQVAYIDNLTGLPNRAHCNEIILKYNEMEILPDLACVYIDLNNLKVTNDLLGHEAGDKFIRDFAAILKEASSPYGFVCRNGGDEFVAIFENCSQKNINDYMNYLNEKTHLYNSKESEIKISFAIGVAFSHEISSNQMNDLLSLADKRMYENKTAYKKSLLNQA
ncbi:GGDEF domain-containing protein [Sedimentibacter sp.]|uniref:GGDEF domain-containing protein n=1 Tax=Sedimentibacter sp. TaxID=1960295 RepID=UPI0028ABB5AD|nr:GGDEF domain-containing protein [Sedimentibacter sp.]